MKIIDYEKTLLSLYQLSFEELYPLIEEVDDHVLSFKIKKFLEATEIKKNQTESRKYYEEIVQYLEHAMDMVRTEFDDFDIFGNFEELL